MLSDLLNFLGKFFWQFISNYTTKSKIAILQKPEIAELISNYSFEEVKIKSLHFKDIEDPFFVHRLLPQYSEHEINSLVLIETPKEKVVFLDSEESESFIKIDYQLLKQNLDSITENDHKLYTENLY